MPIEHVLIAIPCIAAVTFFTRAVPFVFFRTRRPPEIVVFLESHIPPMIMTILVVYCLQGIVWTKTPYGIPEALAVLFVVVIHCALKNPLVSIFGGTVLYMGLVQGEVIQKLMRIIGGN